MDPANIQKNLASCPAPLNAAVAQAAKAVANEKSGRAFLVGGAVRDFLLGNDVTDIDLEIYGIPVQRLQEILEQLFHGRVYLVGASFGVFKIPLDGGYELDVALPRRESKTGKGHKGFTVEGDPHMPVEDAARRRDFTVNSMLADPLTGDVTDPFNGIRDLKDGVLRITDEQTFGDDPLRVYRAVQFAARFNLTPTHETHALLKKMVARGDCDELPKERITNELNKLFMRAKAPSIGLELMNTIGLIARDYPELHALIGVEQEKEWHPEGDVWTHTLLVTDRAAELVRKNEHGLTNDEKEHVVLGALCHDLGKPATTQTIEGRIRSRGHEPAGKSPTQTLLARWRFGEAAERAATVVATEHLKPGMLFFAHHKGTLTDEQYTAALRKLIRRIHPVRWQVLLTAAEADFRGRALPEAAAPAYPIGDLFIKTLKAAKLENGLPAPLLRGEDLLALGIQPGPDMGRIIRAIETARDNGEIKTKKHAIAHVKKQMSS